jgi:hypothetical protein
VRAVLKSVRRAVLKSVRRAVLKSVRAVLKSVRAVLKSVRACRGACDSRVSCHVAFSGVSHGFCPTRRMMIA